MNDPSPTACLSEDTLDAAMQWFERLRDSEIAESEVLAWLAWYERDEANRRVFDELQDFWRLTEGLSHGPDGPLRIEMLQQYSMRDRWQWCLDLWFAGRFGRSDDPSKRPPRPSFKWAGSIAAAALIVGFILTTALVRNGSQSIHGPTMSAAAVPLVRALTLSDDSKVELAPQTNIEVAYSPIERRLEMGSGEANFIVAPNKKQPFVVHVDKLRVRAVGTQFDIRRTADRVVVTVIEGKIDVYREGRQTGQAANVGTAPDLVAAGQVIHVLAGQQLTALQDGSRDSLSPVDSSDETLAWREGRLRYVDEPLASVVADVNRYVARPIEIRDDKLKELTYTGTVFTQSIDEWLSAIPGEFPVVVITEANRTVLTYSDEDSKKRLMQTN